MRLVFPNESGRPDKRHEFKLKRIAFHAKMNCGQCVSKHGNKCSEGPYCSNFFLHKFRHTFATRNLQDHVCDIKTLQNWMGHKDLGIHDGLLEGRAEQRRDGTRQFK